MLLAEMVAALGFGVETVSDGRRGPGIQAKSPADVIVTDLTMPRLDGSGLLRAFGSAGIPRPQSS